MMNDSILKNSAPPLENRFGILKENHDGCKKGIHNRVSNRTCTVSCLKRTIITSANVLWSKLPVSARLKCVVVNYVAPSKNVVVYVTRIVQRPGAMKSQIDKNMGMPRFFYDYRIFIH
jgi:hypothetical protein